MDALTYDLNSHLAEIDYANELQETLISEAMETVGNFTIEKSIVKLEKIFDSRIEAEEFVLNNATLQDFETQLGDWLTWEQLEAAGLLDQFKKFIIKQL